MWQRSGGDFMVWGRIVVDVKISTSLGWFIHRGKSNKAECGHEAVHWELVIDSFKVDLLCAD